MAGKSIKRRRRRGDPPAQPNKKATDMDRMLGVVVKDLRTQLKLSQEKVAKAVSVSLQQIQKYEYGHNRMSGGMLASIASALAVHPGELFDLARAKLAVGQ